MAIERYLAMTAAEIASVPALPRRLAYMACHFSPYATGLSNLPRQLPPASVLLLTDRTPISGHDPELIARQLADTAEAHRCHSVLLDFQRPECAEAARLVRFLVTALPCPVAVAQPYAAELDCPVLLPPIPLDVSPAEYLAPWQGREIWLEAALDSLCISLTQSGAVYFPAESDNTPLPHRNKELHCHYRTEVKEDQALFTLRRQPEDLDSLLEEAEALGVTLAMGLYQELGRIWN